MVMQIYPFNEGRVTGFFVVLAMFIIAWYNMNRAKEPYIRRVAAIDAVDDAIGRATELGKPLMVSIGVGTMGTWTIAAISLLSYVARACARNDIRLLVPLGGGENYTEQEIAREVVQNQFTLEGKPERYTPDDMPFLSARQFAWATAYVGMIVRHKPAANIMTGTQLGSAVYMAEVSQSVGSMQISSTTYISNIACLAVTSDYIMIGEEALAAGAYLSKDKVQLASIRTQDIMKFAEIIVIVFGFILLNLGSDIIKVILKT
jgi:hypothetical protein